MPGKETVVIGCRLPQGLILTLPKKTARVMLAGPKLVIVEGKKLSSSFATTQVDADFWTTWKAAYADSPFLSARTIFEAKTETEAAAKGKELAKEKTGFEQMPQEAMGVEKAAV
jgi:hypothetical protein